MLNRWILDAENKKIKEETAEKIKYMLEEKFELEREIRVGEDAAEKLEVLESKLKSNMIIYAGIKENKNEL